MKILWLCSWYPNKLKPFDGDFIQRHAQAASLLNSIDVIFIKKDDAGIVTKNVKEETTLNDHLTETIIYYKPFKTGIGFIDKIISNTRYRNLYKKFIKKYISTNGKPALVHVHIAMNAGIVALWVKKKFGIPFLISEQWTGYLPHAKPNINDEHYVLKAWRKEVFLQALKITAVSNVLGNAIIKRFSKQSFTVIHNVVNTDIFFPGEKNITSQTKFIHVSTMNFQKNIVDILQALKKLKENKIDFNCSFFVPHPAKLQSQLELYDITECTKIHAEVPQQILSEEMRQADALILYSHSETFGCVVIEANACGIPAILSDLPVFHEYILENKTGIFVKPADPDALTEALAKFSLNKNDFSAGEIAAYTKEHFSYQVIAKQFDDLYKNCFTEPTL